jgi:phosphoenolpyruvate carboxykinase (ATP)
MAIGHTRGLLRAVLDGRLANAPMRKDANFGFLVPESAADVPADVLDPRASWANKKAYDDTARCLTRDFERNFAEYEPHVGNDIKRVAIKAAM